MVSINNKILFIQISNKHAKPKENQTKYERTC